jgi:hypothetical protein
MEIPAKGDEMKARVALLLMLLPAVMTAAPILTVTVLPNSSGTYPVGTSFFSGEVAQTTNPIGPFSGQAVQFIGWNTPGGSHMSLNGGPCGACLVYQYELSFDQPVDLSSITFTGDAFNGSTFQLISPTLGLLDTAQFSSGNVGHPVSFIFNTPGATGTSFILDEFDFSTVWRYRSDIVVNASAAPEPGSAALIPGSLLLMLAYRKLRASALKGRR